MAEPLRPAAAKTFGRSNWIFIPTIADYATGDGPTVAEATGASAIDISRIVFGDGAPTPGQNTNLVDQKRRFADTTIYQFVGDTTYTGGQITYAFDQQGATGSDPVKLWEEWLNTSGVVTGFLARRFNVPRATAVAAGQFVDIYPVEIGPSMPVETDPGTPAAEGAAMCSFAVVGEPLFKVVVQA